LGLDELDHRVLAESLGHADSTISFLFSNETPGTLRGFTGGAAGAPPLLLRGPFSEVQLNGLSLTENNHIAFVYDSSAANIKGYLNGVLQTTVNQSAFTITGTSPTSSTNSNTRP
jgi:hypothetical protein